MYPVRVVGVFGGGVCGDCAVPHDVEKGGAGGVCGGGGGADGFYSFYFREWVIGFHQKGNLAHFRRFDGFKVIIDMEVHNG